MKKKLIFEMIFLCIISFIGCTIFEDLGIDSDQIDNVDQNDNSDQTDDPDQPDDTGGNTGEDFTPFTFVAYGDSRSNSSTHNTICSRINSENPELVIHSGDLWDGYSSSTWKGHITSKSNLNTLLKNNKFLVAIGNHEGSSEVKNFSPSIIRNNNLTYSFLQGNVFFVSGGYSPSASYLESQLQKSEAQNADFRIIFHHRPIYSSGSHGGSGNSSVEKICDKYNVTFSFSGHDHHYERSKVIYNGSNVYSGTNVPANTNGTTYIVTGGGGAPLYSVGSNWWTDKRQKTNHFCILTAYNDRIEMTVKNKSGVVIEKFVRRK